MKWNKIKFLLSMMFVTILLDVIPSAGFIALGKISITTMHIPTILTAIALGPGYGVITGIVFGVISLFHAMSRESAPLDVLFSNPLISILPRIGIALISGYLYLLLSKFSKREFKLLPTAAASLIGSFSNTVLVFTALYLLCPDQLASSFGLSSESQVLPVLMDTFSDNMTVEAVVCTVVNVLVMYLICKLGSRNGEV